MGQFIIYIKISRSLFVCPTVLVFFGRQGYLWKAYVLAVVLSSIRDKKVCRIRHHLQNMFVWVSQKFVLECLFVCHKCLFVCHNQLPSYPLECLFVCHNELPSHPHSYFDSSYFMPLCYPKGELRAPLGSRFASFINHSW